MKLDKLFIDEENENAGAGPVRVFAVYGGRGHMARAVC